MESEDRKVSDEPIAAHQDRRATTIGFGRSILLFIFACMIYPFVISLTGARELESQVARKLEYMVRDRLGLLPQVDPLLKLIVWDDKTLSYLSQSGRYSKDIPLTKWAEVVRALAAQGPSSIMIGRPFASPMQSEGTNLFSDALGKSAPPVYFGALVAPERIHGRVFVPEEKGVESKIGIKSSKKFGYDKFFVHGPEARISSSKSVKIGHNTLTDNEFFVPWYPLGGSRVLPHFALRAFNPETSDFKITASGFRINRRNVEVDSLGRVMIDIPRIEEISTPTNTISFGDVLESMENGKPIEFVRSGDYVVIVPNYFFGGMDLKHTYAGLIEIGMLNAVVMSNVLTGHWFKYFDGGWWFGLILIAIAATMGLFLPSGVFLSIFTMGFLVLVLGSITSGVYFRVIVSWFYPAIFYLGTGLAVFLEAQRQSMIRTERFRSSLGGVLAPKQVQELIKQGGATRPEPSEQFVSVVFLDIVGFSKIAEEASPKEVFAQLRMLMIKMRNLVHEHGGVVDRSLGDGMVAFFGYNYTGSRRIDDHAEQALQCAMKMQLFSAKETVAASKKGSSNVFPLRIGINTGLVFIGDLGDENRVDFTLIGHGVNMAQRLEAAAESFGVMVGPETRETIKGNHKLFNLLSLRSMQIKHHDELVEAYEFDSFHEQRDLLRSATDVYRSMHNLQRQTERHVPDKGTIKVAIKVSTSQSSGELVDFSMGGFSVLLESFLARGVVTHLTLDTADGQLGENCREYGLFPVPVEVRWGLKVPGGYLHGMETKGLNDIQRGLLHRELRGQTAGHGSSRRWSVPEGMPLIISTDKGEARIVNFSLNGIGVVIVGPALAVDAKIELSFQLSPSPIREIAAGAGVKSAVATVRRTGDAGKLIFYGLEIIGIDDKERLQLFKGLQSLVRPSQAA